MFNKMPNKRKHKKQHTETKDVVEIPMTEEEKKYNKELLKKKLKEKLNIKKTQRMSRISRENKMDKLEERLKSVKTKREKRDIEKQLNILEDVEDRDIDNMMNQTYPEYGGQ
jgi:hypothetical protein